MLFSPVALMFSKRASLYVTISAAITTDSTSIWAVPPLTSFEALAIVNSLCPRSARQLDNWAVRSCQATKGADSAQTSSNAFLSMCARR